MKIRYASDDPQQARDCAFCGEYATREVAQGRRRIPLCDEAACEDGARDDGESVADYRAAPSCLGRRRP